MLLFHETFLLYTNVVCYQGCTAVYQALLNANLRVAELLISNGADINMPDEDGCTPLMSACACGKSDVFDFLLKNGADVTRRNKEGMTCHNFAGTLI